MRGTGSATDLSKSIYSLKQQQDWRAHKYATREIQMEKDIKAVVMKAIGFAAKT